MLERLAATIHFSENHQLLLIEKLDNNNNNNNNNNSNNNDNNYLDLVSELEKLWKMKVTIIPIVFAAFGTVTKGLLKGLEGLEIRGRVESIQTTTLLRTARILRRVLET